MHCAWACEGRGRVRRGVHTSDQLANTWVVQRRACACLQRGYAHWGWWAGMVAKAVLRLSLLILLARPQPMATKQAKLPVPLLPPAALQHHPGHRQLLPVLRPPLGASLGKRPDLHLQVALLPSQVPSTRTALGRRHQMRRRRLSARRGPSAPTPCMLWQG
jgi:hypothetical protein